MINVRNLIKAWLQAYLLDRPFQERRAILGAHAHTHVSVINRTRKFNFDYTFLLLNCLCLINMPILVTIIWTAVIDY